MYTKAARLGSGEAFTHIGMMHEMGRREEKFVGEGYEAFIKASKLGNINSLQILKDKVDVLHNDEVMMQFSTQEEEERHAILRDHTIDILSSHMQLQKRNEEVTEKIAKNQATPEAQRWVSERY